MALFGILNAYKPAGISSRDAVNRVERLTRPAKAGHAGTLDPLATGVLVICVGSATRLIQYVQRMPKRYQATFLLGQSSPTDDLEGEVTLLEGASVPTRAAIEAALPAFVGQIEQRPPAHSAVKIAGRRAYALARRGQPFELAPRAVTIHSLKVRRYEFPELEMDIECGSGTYVRSLGRDLAAALGTAAVMSALERTAIGGFRVEDAICIDDVTAETLPRQLQPALTAVADLPRVELTDGELAEIRHGRPIAARRDAHPPLAEEAEQLSGNCLREGDSPHFATCFVASEARTGKMGTVPDNFRTVSEQLEWAAINSAGQLAAILREKRAGQLWPVRNLL